MAKSARLGDPISHGGQIITASPNVTNNGVPVARVGDQAQCRIHGVVTITKGSSKVTANGKARARVGDTCSCGAVILQGADTIEVGG